MGCVYGPGGSPRELSGTIADLGGPNRCAGVTRTRYRAIQMPCSPSMNHVSAEVHPSNWKQTGSKSRRSGPSRRKPHGHSRTLAQAAFDPELTLVKLDDVLNDRESESGPAEFARTRAVDPIKAFRQSRNVGGRDSLPGVGDDKLDTGLAAVPGNPGGTCLGRHFTAAQRVR